MKKIILAPLIFVSVFFPLTAFAITGQILVEPAPYVRPIGFSLNVGAISSLTYEGRVIVGLVPNLSAVASPSFQSTLDLPVYGWRSEKGMSYFPIKRYNLGLGLRHHFYDYDSRDELFLEYMARFGGTNIGTDKKTYFSIIPSILLGYSTVYDSGYMFSIGGGLEYEALIGEKEYHAKKLWDNYFTYKVPLTGEISLGWCW